MQNSLCALQVKNCMTIYKRTARPGRRGEACRRRGCCCITRSSRGGHVVVSGARVLPLSGEGVVRGICALHLCIEKWAERQQASRLWIHLFKVTKWNWKLGMTRQGMRSTSVSLRSFFCCTPSGMCKSAAWHMLNLITKVECQTKDWSRRVIVVAGSVPVSRCSRFFTRCGCRSP